MSNVLILVGSLLQSITISLLQEWQLIFNILSLLSVVSLKLPFLLPALNSSNNLSKLVADSAAKYVPSSATIILLPPRLEL